MLALLAHGQGQGSVALTLSPTDFKVFFVHIFPINKKKLKKKHWLEILCVCPAAPEEIPAAAFPLTSTLQRDRPAFYAQMAAPMGGKSVPSHRGAVFGQLCLRIIPDTCPLAHHLA